MFRRPPDFVIGNPADPYLRRWWFSRNRFFCIYLHHIRKSDDDRALHDHPWTSVSFLLCGSLREIYKGDWGYVARRIPWLWPVYRSPTFAHRLVVPPTSKGAWTLFLTGPRVRQWGFLCPKGWRHWKAFTAADNKGEIGRGCGEME